MNKDKSKRNKTLELSAEETQRYLRRCVFSPLKDSEFSSCVICGDTFEVLPSLQKESYDLLIVDPPYNLTKEYDGKAFSKMSEEKYARFTEEWISAVKPLLKSTASIYVCCDFRSGIVIAPILQKHFKIRNRITWQREKGRGAKSNWKNGMEDLWFCTVSDEYHFDLDKVKMRRKVKAPYKENGEPKDWFEEKGVKYRDTCPSNFWDDITVPYWSMSENTPHPTQKPEKLIAKLILASSKEGDRVLDPFAGSGTTAVVSKKLKREFTVIEKSESYCAFAQARLEKAETDGKIQGYEKGVFFARGDN